MKRKQNGITLIALVITIIVILILAGVSISALTGENGVLTKTSAARIKNEIASVQEKANFAYADINTDNIANKLDKTTAEMMEYVANNLNEEGYTTVLDMSEGNVTGISVSEENISLVPTNEEGEKTKDITVSLVTEGDNLNPTYLVTISNQQYKMSFIDGKIKISDEPIQANDGNRNYTLTIVPIDMIKNNAINCIVNGENITTEKSIDFTDSLKITVNSTDKEGFCKLKLLYNNSNKECTIKSLYKNHICTNEPVVGKQVCSCGDIKYIDVESRYAGSGTIYNNNTKNIILKATYQSGEGYYRITSLSYGQYWTRSYAGYDIYIPNTIKMIGQRWICDWGVTANIHYDGTQAEWNAIQKNSDWCGLMSARIFFKDGLLCNSHSYGEYVITKEPTNTENGSKTRECKYCGYKDSALIDKYEQSSTKFLGVTVIDNNKKTITILPTYQYNNVTYTITELSRGQFWTRSYAGYDIYLPNTIKIIKFRWICDWGVTANIYYNGTRVEWNAIQKDSDWCGLMSAKIHCTDD